MQQAIEMATGLLNGVACFSIDVMICIYLGCSTEQRTESVRNKLNGIVVVMDFIVEICKIEPVCDVILVNFTEIFVPLAA